jgi:hypothetical protein
MGVERSNPSIIRSIAVYTGSIAVASGFSGDKDVTIASIDPTRSIILPVGGNVVSSAQGYFKGFGSTGNANLSYVYVQILNATTVRFATVSNIDVSPQNIVYSFMVVEFK